jgi:hypothetical protein
VEMEGNNMGFFYLEMQQQRLEEERLKARQKHDNVVSMADYRKPANLNQEDLVEVAEGAVEMLLDALIVAKAARLRKGK